MYIHINATGYTLTWSNIEELWEVKLGEYSVLQQKTDWYPSEVDAKHANQDKLLDKNAQEKEYIKYASRHTFF